LLIVTLQLVARSVMFYANKIPIVRNTRADMYELQFLI